MTDFAPTRSEFIEAMATGAEWPVVFGSERPAAAREVAMWVASITPSESELLRHALAPTPGLERLVAAHRAGAAFLAANYWGATA